MNAPPAEPPAPGPEGRSEVWSRQRWLTLVMLVFAIQMAVIFAVGQKHFPPRRAVTNVPHLALADSADELVALDDPTLFALPHPGDFPSVDGSRMSAAAPPFFRWTEPPGELPSPAGDALGAVFTRFMQTNLFGAPLLDFKLEPELNEPALTLPPVFAGNSALRVTGDLARRKWLNPVSLTNWPSADVIAPSRVQVWVDKSGEVVSAVLLPPDNPGEAAAQSGPADKNALEVARTARFSPGPRLTRGQLIFDWRTVPTPATHSPAAAP